MDLLVPVFREDASNSKYCTLCKNNLTFCIEKEEIDDEDYNIHPEELEEGIISQLITQRLPIRLPAKRK